MIALILAATTCLQAGPNVPGPQVLLAECESTTVNKSPYGESTFSVVGGAYKQFKVTYLVAGRPARGVIEDRLTTRPFQPGERVYWIARVTRDGEVSPVTQPGIAARHFLPDLALLSRPINEQEVRGALNRDTPPEVRTTQLLAHLVSRANSAPLADNRAMIIKEHSHHPDPAIREYIRWLARAAGN